MDKFERLDPYVMETVLGDLPDSDLIAFCRSGAEFAKLCDNDHLWSSRLIRRYGVKSLEWKPKNMSYFEYYNSGEMKMLNSIYESTHKWQYGTPLQSEDPYIAAVKNNYLHVLEYLFGFAIFPGYYLGNVDVFIKHDAAKKVLDTVMEFGSLDVFRLFLDNNVVHISDRLVVLIVNYFRGDIVRLLLSRNIFPDPNVRLNFSDDDSLYIAGLLLSPQILERLGDKILDNIIKLGSLDSFRFVLDNLWWHDDGHLIHLIITNLRGDIIRLLMERGLLPNTGVDLLDANDGRYIVELLKFPEFAKYREVAMNTAASNNRMDIIKLFWDILNMPPSREMVNDHPELGNYLRQLYIEYGRAVSNEHVNALFEDGDYQIVKDILEKTPYRPTSKQIDRMIEREHYDTAKFLFENYDIVPTDDGLSDLFDNNQTDFALDIAQKSSIRPKSYVVDTYIIDQNYDMAIKLINQFGVFPTSRGLTRLFQDDQNDLAMDIISRSNLRPQSTDVDILILKKHYTLVEKIVNEFSIAPTSDGLTNLLRDNKIAIADSIMSVSSIRPSPNNIDELIISGNNTPVVVMLIHKYGLQPTSVGIRHAIKHGGIDVLTGVPCQSFNSEDVDLAISSHQNGVFDFLTTQCKVSPSRETIRQLIMKGEIDIIRELLAVKLIDIKPGYIRLATEYGHNELANLLRDNRK